MRKIALAALIIASAPCSAWADAAAARAAYGRGEKAAGAGRYGEAARAFAEADTLAPTDTALEAALEAAVRGDEPVLGMQLVERAQRSPSSKALDATERARTSFEGRAALVVVTCVAESPPCTALLDGERLGSPRAWVAPGVHEVLLRWKGESSAQRIDASPGSPREVAFIAPRPPAAFPAAPVAPPPPRAGVSRVWFFAAGGAAVALAGVTIGHAIAAKSNKDEFDASNGRATRPRLEELASHGKSLETRTNAFLVATGVVAATTTTLAVFAVDWSSGPAKARAWITPSGGGAHAAIGGAF